MPKRQAEESAASDSKRFQKLQQREHVLLRPDAYIGSVEQRTSLEFILENGKMVERSVTYSPALLKIIDEPICNALDQQHVDTTIKNINVHVVEGEILIENDGKSIPVVVHSKHNVLIPTMVFSQFQSGSNFDDTQQRYKSGRNGLGVKLTNTWSTMFHVEVDDPINGKTFKQTFSDNMSVIQDATVKNVSKKKGRVSVRFIPDYARLGLSGMDQLHYQMIQTRMVDIAACTKPNIKVCLNEEHVPIRGLKEYTALFEGGSDAIFETVKVDGENRLEIAVFRSPGTFRSVGFVNGVRSNRGTHVDFVCSRIVGDIAKKLKVAPPVVKRNMFLIVKIWIDKPAFDSQTKERLSTPASKFGLDFKITQRFKTNLSLLLKEAVNEAADEAALKEISKETKRVRISGIPKLEDARNAGKKLSDCSLLLTEGDSAKALAIAGLSSVNSDDFGVYPLRGKVLNTRKATSSELTSNAEIMNIHRIVGLEPGKVYDETSISKLRYKHIVAFMDQDLDGFHIVGLIMNFLHDRFPSILRVKPDFLQRFTTPIIRVTHPNKEVTDFESIAMFREWRNGVENIDKHKIKYFKGLGTSTPADARVYFSNYKRNSHCMLMGTDGTDEFVDMAFNKKRADDRKDWLREYNPESVLEYDETNSATFKDFINKELIHFSSADNVRSIPSMVDGFKPVMRKVLWTSFTREKNEIKVPQLAGSVSKYSNYHHGEVSMYETIVGMAQNHTGSNNLSWLVPMGQFGSRLDKRSVHAQCRYLFTQLDPISRKVFRPEDDLILQYVEEDGHEVEPRYYIPVIPTVLVNGGEGIGTGWSTSIPPYKPADLVGCMLSMLDGVSVSDVASELVPWWRGFTGSVVRTESGFETSGKWEISGNSVVITELPPRVWTDHFLASMHKHPLVNEVENEKLFSSVGITLYVDQSLLDMEHDEIGRQLGLVTHWSVNNMHAFDGNGKLQKYTIESIISEFFRIRLESYTYRKKVLVEKAEFESILCGEKARFIRLVVSGELVIMRVPRIEIENRLKELGFSDRGGYNYLLDMPIKTLTLEAAVRLEQRAEDAQIELDNLIKTSETDMWRTDLHELLDELIPLETIDYGEQPSVKRVKRKTKK